MLSTFDRLLSGSFDVKDSVRRKTADGVSYGVKLLRPAAGYTRADLESAAVHGVAPTRKAPLGEAQWNRSGVATGETARRLVGAIIADADIDEQTAAQINAELAAAELERGKYKALSPEQQKAVSESGLTVDEWLAAHKPEEKPADSPPPAETEKKRGKRG